MENATTSISRFRNLLMVDYVTYINIVNYFNKINNELEIEKYVLASSEITGNKIWRERSSNLIVAKRVFRGLEDDTYYISRSLRSKK